MSFSKTTDQMRRRTKTVTRRHHATWLNLKRGDLLMAIEKGQGIKKGEHQIRIGPIEVTDVRVEPLNEITPEELVLEGLASLTPGEFAVLFPGEPDQLVRRIEFKHL